MMRSSIRVAAATFALILFLQLFLFAQPTISSVVFSGTGLNDASSGGSFSGAAANAVFVVIIDHAGTPDTFKWQKNGGSFTTGVAITGGSQSLSNGVQIRFAATTGHTLNDQWAITVSFHGSLNSSNFIAPELNAIFRSAEDKRDFRSVRDFGAVANNSTDDGAAFNAALTAAAAAKSNGVIVPGGTYYISTKILMSQSGVGLYCAPNTVLVNHVASSAEELLMTGTNNSVQGCTFDANSVAIGSGTAAVRVNGATHATFRDVTFINTVNYGLRFDGSTDLTVDHLTSPNLQFFSSTDIKVSGSTLYNFAIDSPAGGPGPGSITVTKNTLHTDAVISGAEQTCLTIGDFSTSHTNPPANFSVTGNTCTITGTSSGAKAFACYSIVGVQGGTFGNNSCYEVGQYVDYAGLELGCAGCSAVGNDFYMPDSFSQHYHGITTYGPKTALAGNVVFGWGNADGDGIRLYSQNADGTASLSDDGVIADSTFVNPSASSGSIAGGISIICNYSSSGSSLNNKVHGNVIDTTANRGIEVQDFSGTCPVSAFLDANTIANAATGILLNNTTVTLGANRMTGVTTKLSTAGTNTLEPAAFLSAVSAPNFTDMGVTDANILATDSNGKLIQSPANALIAGMSSFTPTATGWYRIATQSGPHDFQGTIDIASDYNNKVSNLIVDFTARGYGQECAVTARLLGAYAGNMGFVDKIEASNDGSTNAYLDIHINDVTSASAITIMFLGQSIPAAAIVSSPVVGATPGSGAGAALVDLNATGVSASNPPGIITSGPVAVEGSGYFLSTSQGSAGGVWVCWDSNGRLVNSSTACASVGPSGSAGGDLGGTYPNPTVTNLSHVTNGSLANSGLANTGTAGTYTKVTTNAQGLVTSGTTLGPSDLPSPGPVINTSQFDKTTDTTLANVTGLSLTLTGGKTYLFEGMLQFSTTSTGGTKTIIGGTATFTSMQYELILLDNTHGGIVKQFGLTSATAVTDTTAPTGLYWYKGSAVVNAGGTITLQFAQQNAAGTSSVLAGSSLSATLLP